MSVVTQAKTLVLYHQDEAAEFELTSGDSGAVQVALTSGSAWNGATVVIERSLDGDTWYDLEPDPVSFTADGISWRVSWAGVPKLRARVATAATPVPDYPVLTVYVVETSDA